MEEKLAEFILEWFKGSGEYVVADMPDAIGLDGSFNGRLLARDILIFLAMNAG